MCDSYILSNTLLSYRNSLYVGDYDAGIVTADDADILLAIVAEMMANGYGLTSDLLEFLKGLKRSSLMNFRERAKTVLEKKTGSNVSYVPLFRKFPEEVPDHDHLINIVFGKLGAEGAFLVYEVYGVWSPEMYNGTWTGRQLPEKSLQKAIQRPELVHKKRLNLIGAAHRADALEVCKNLMCAHGSLSESDRAFVKEVVQNIEGLSILPTEIPNKENMAFVIASCPKEGLAATELSDKLQTYIKTATDVLRVAVAFSGSDVSLVNHTRFRMSNSQRRFILRALNFLEFKSGAEDMLRFRGLWLVLAKYLHVNAYSKQYPRATELVYTIRAEPKKISTFNRKVEAALLNLEQKDDTKDIEELLALLRSRPGDFARRLDHVIRTVPKSAQSLVVTRFQEALNQVATPLLVNLATHFGHRTNKAPLRVHLPKGSATNCIIQEKDPRDLLPKDITERLIGVINAELKGRFSKLGSLGNIYIDPILKDILIPMSMRNISESLRTVARGSKFRADKDAKVIRLFLYWEDIKENGQSQRVDVDLSLLQLDKDFNSGGEIAYYNLKNGAMTHSGDFTSAPNGAAEFIDIDIAKTKELFPNIRYIGVTVNSFTGQPFDSFTAKAGYMVRDGETGDLFEPKTVQQKYDVVAGTKFALPLVIDLEKLEFYWLDFGLKSKRSCCANLESEKASVGYLVEYAINMYREKASLWDLIMLHGEARAKSIATDISERQEFDRVYDMDFCTKVDLIMSQYLA